MVSVNSEMPFDTETFDLHALRRERSGLQRAPFRNVDTFEGVRSDPASLHKYVYGNADPVNHTDPTGKFSVLEGAVVGGIIGLVIGASYGTYKGYQHTGKLFSLETLQYAALYGLAGFAAGAMIGAAAGWLSAGSGIVSANGTAPVGTYTRVVTKIFDHVAQNIISGRNPTLGGLGLTTGSFVGGVIAGASVYVVTEIKQTRDFDEYAISGLAATTLTVPFWRFVCFLGGGAASGPIVLTTSFIAGFNAGYFGAKGIDAAGESLSLWD